MADEWAAWGERASVVLRHVCRAELGPDGALVGEEPIPPFALRLAVALPGDDGRRVVINGQPDWIELVVREEPPLGLLLIDDFLDLDDHAVDRLGELARVAAAYLSGGGRHRARRTVLGRRRQQWVVEIDGRTWVARE